MKKIIIGPGYPLRGGISESNQSLYGAFKKKKEDCEIISYSLQYPKILFPGKKQVMENADNQSTGVVNMINTLNPFSWFATARYIIKQNPNYVIVRYWHPYFAICLGIISRILKQKSISVIAWIDNVEPHESLPFQKKLTSFLLNYCDAFLVMSKSVKNNLLKYKQTHNKKIIISPHPIYDVFGKSLQKVKARQKLGIPSIGKYILFFGLIRKYKGLDLLLEVMASEKVQNLNIKLIIAGEFYDEKQKYLNKIDLLKIKGSILLHDFYIPNKDVVNYFCASDIVVQPYLSATQSGVSMISYNFNKPMILTDVGGLSEYVSHNKDGYLVDVNRDSVVEALIDFYEKDKEDSFMKAVEKRKSIYNWDYLCSNFNKLYNESKKM